MGWFNVLKGAYPSLQQIDKTLPVASTATGIVRGSLIYQEGTEFKLATSTQADEASAYIFFSLQDQTGLTAGMAGGKGRGADSGVARITGIAVGQPFEFETSEFDIANSYSVGDLLMPTDGGELTTHTDDKNVVAQVTKAVYNKYINSAVAITGFRTGANRSILTARTMWVPTFSTA